MSDAAAGGRRQAWSPQRRQWDGVAKLAERRRRHGACRAGDKYVGLADPSLLARIFPDLDLLDPKSITSELERRPVKPKQPRSRQG